MAIRNTKVNARYRFAEDCVLICYFFVCENLVYKYRNTTGNASSSTKPHFQLEQHTYNETTYRMDHHTQYFLHQRKMGGQYTDFGWCHIYHYYDPVQVLY